MNIKIEDKTSTRKTVSVTVPANVIEEKQKALTKEYASQVKIPGFRPGKVPMTLVIKNFGKEIDKELVQRVAQEAYKEVSKDENIKIFALVDVAEPKIEAGKDSVIVFDIDIVPNFNLPEYKGLEIKKYDETVSDEDVSKMIETIRSQRSEFKVAEKAASKGDFVKLAYTSKLDGKPLEEALPEVPVAYAKQSLTWEEAGAEETYGATVKEIVDAIVGLKAGDEKEVKATFSKDFTVEALQGKTVVYSVNVQEVRERILPELNEEFFKGLQVANLEELKTKVRENLETKKKNDTNAEKRQELIGLLTAKLDFDLPETAIKREAYNIFLEYANTQVRQGVSVEDIKAKQEETLKESENAAKIRVRTQFVLDAIAKAEGIKVTKEDLNARITMEAYMSQTPVEKFVKELSKDRERVEELQRNVLHNKALDFVLENVKK